MHLQHLIIYAVYRMVVDFLIAVLSTICTSNNHGCARLFM